MANRSFIDVSYGLVKRAIRLYAAVTVTDATIALQKWTFPSLGVGGNALAAATTATALPTGNPYPLQYAAGSEGIRSVTRTTTGLWTVKFQDNYRRLLSVSAHGSLAGGIAAPSVVSENLTLTDMAAVGGSEVGLAFAYGGALADPTTLQVMHLEFVLSDATEP